MCFCPFSRALLCIHRCPPLNQCALDSPRHNHALRLVPFPPYIGFLQASPEPPDTLLSSKPAIPASQRLRGLASGRRLYLVVSSEDADAPPTASDESQTLDNASESPESYAGAVLQSSLRFPNIAGAVASSR